MALVKQATKISIDSSQIPSGYTNPGGTNLASSQPTYLNKSFSIIKSTVDDSVKATTFDQILSDVTIGIEKQVADMLTADDIGTTATVNYNIDWKKIGNNQAISADFYNNTAVSYVAVVDVYLNFS